MKSKKAIWLSLAAVIMILASHSSAALLEGESLLPDSSLYDGYIYYGQEVDTGDGIKYMQGRIDFAVYDTAGGNEWATATGYSNPGSGRYVYAYQIFNNYEGYSQVAIEAFSIFGLNGAAISFDSGSLGTAEDPLGGQDASGTSSTNTTITWNFAFDGSGNYTIGTDGHSFFLIFSSDYSWVKGGYSLTPYEVSNPVPGGSNDGGSNNPTPEPTTVALLGLGGMVAFVRRRKN